jgi:hypothetical protein
MYTKSEIKELRDKSFDRGFYIGLILGMVLGALLVQFYTVIK